MYSDKLFGERVQDSCGRSEVRSTLVGHLGANAKHMQNMLKKSKIRLMVSDLDGTLLQSDGRLDPNISSEIENNRCLFTIASGRNKALIKSYVRELNIGIPYIANNGAEIVLGNKIIYQKSIVRKELMYILNLAERLEIECLINCDKCVYTMGAVNYMRVFAERFDGILPVLSDVDPGIIAQEEVQKIMLYHKQASILHYFVSELNKNCINTACSKSEGDFYCAKHMEADKGNALKRLCKILRINLDEVLVFGDNYNDLSMFEVAKYSVATENAEEIVKKRSTFITKSNDESGVSYFLKNVYKPFCFFSSTKQ